MRTGRHTRAAYVLGAAIRLSVWRVAAPCLAQAASRRLRLGVQRHGVHLGLACWLLASVLWITSSLGTTHAIAQPIPVAAATTNSYWAGYVATHQGPFTGVQATWTVPRIPCSPASPPPSTAYMWIGEGGYLQGIASPLVQAGTASDCVSSRPVYHAFFEWYPGIYATDFPMTINAGDTVTVRVAQDVTDHWVLSVHDDTSGQGSVTATFYRADVGSADFVVERPTLCSMLGCNQVPLSSFGSIIFENVRVWSAGGHVARALSKPVAIALVDQSSGRTLALPGKVRSAPDALSVLWQNSN